MKTKLSIASIVGAGSLLAFSLALPVTLTAGPGLQYWQTIRTPAQPEKVQARQTVALVCSRCRTVSAVTVDQAPNGKPALREGSAMSCPSCSMKSKIVLKRQRNDPNTHSEIVCVNDRGEECAFIALAPTSP